MQRSITALGAAAVAMLLIAAPVSAQTTFDFANLRGIGNPNNFLPTNGVQCTGADMCAASIGAPLSFSKGLFTVDATGFYNGNAAMAVQDSETGYNGTNNGDGTKGAGLGVYHRFDAKGKPNVNSDDNITAGETLKLRFNTVVLLTSVGLRSENHNFTSWSPNAVFEYSVDGLSWLTGALANGVGTLAINQSSQDFYFRYAMNPGQGKVADQFYISAATVTAGDPNVVVPEPSTYALMGFGLLSLGAVARRRSAARQS